MMTEETPLIPMDGRRVGRAIVAYFHVLFRYSSRRFPTPMSVRPTTSALYRCLDKVLEHKQALLGRLPERWRGLFGAKFDVLLYDLTSTYFESSTLRDEKDKRSDCVQVVIALIVTPEGFPMAYEVLADNTSDRNTLREFLKTIKTQYGKAERISVMDRGIPTENVTLPGAGIFQHLWVTF